MRKMLLVLAVAGLGATAQFQPPAPDWTPFEQRTELAEAGSLEGARRVLRFVQISDAHVLDDDAPYPLRQEGLDRLGDPFSSSQRPQDEYTDEVLDAAIQQINGIHAGDRLDFVLTTGDNIDNALENELMRFLDNFEGTLTTTGPISGFRCVPDGQSPDSQDSSHDEATRCTHLPEALAADNTPLAEGLPWFSAFGNHDGLIQGNRTVGPAAAEIAAQHGRYFLRQHEYVAMHFVGATPCLGGTPMGGAHDDKGHGYGYAEQRLCDDDPDNDGYYAFTMQGVRFIVLDTVIDDFVTANDHLDGLANPQQTLGYDVLGGYAEGAIDPAQFAWLMQEVESHDDKLIIVASHHTLNSMAADCVGDACPRDVLSEAGYRTATDLAEALGAHPNVIAWLGGHTHRHRIEAKAADMPGGFWNIETSSLIDTPQESRLVELWTTADGRKGFLALSDVSHGFERSRALAAADPQRPDGGGTPADVLLWFDIPPGIAPDAQPALPSVLVTHLAEPAPGTDTMVGEPLNVTLHVEDSLLQTPVDGLSVAVAVTRTDPAAPQGVATVAMLEAGGIGGGGYRVSFTPVTARVHYLDFTLIDPSGAYPTASRVVSVSVGGLEVSEPSKKSPVPWTAAIAGLATLALVRRRHGSAS